MKIRISRRFIISLIFLVLIMIPAFAFAGDQDAVYPEETVISLSDTLDSDQLLSGYIDKELGLTAEVPRKMLLSRKPSLSGVSLNVYNALLPEIQKIASGQRTSTEIEVTLDAMDLPENGWTREELGVTTFINENGNISDETSNAIYDRIGYNFRSVVNALLANCPYDLYWFDKTAGYSMRGPGFSRTTDMSFIRISSGMTIYFSVSSDYSSGNYTVDPSKTVKVKTAIKNIQAVVNDHSSENDYQKVLSYKNEICNRVAYNNAAANDDSTPYGDPWQLISVFDGDETTDVVCEGYSKAFQYLCDLSTFRSDKVSCISVKGGMDGGTGAGGHMWNIITMNDGINYIADITNCDSGTVGYPDLLFLKGYSQGSMEGGYVFNCKGYPISYVYDTSIIDMYGDDLNISGTDYFVETSHDLQEVKGYDATCTEDGMIDHWVCSNCGLIFSDKDGTVEISPEDMVIPAVGHIIDIVQGTPATCTEPGLTDGEVCHVCGEILREQEVIPANGHTVEVIPEVLPTCTEDGKTQGERCTVCNEWLTEIETVPALGHSVEVIPGVPATCTENGNIEYWTCTKCHRIFSDEKCENEISEADTVIPAMGHTEEVIPEVPATCTEPGYTEGIKCSVCDGVIVSPEIIPATGHIHGEAVKENVTDPKCAESGHYDSVIYCSVCGEELSREIIYTDPLGHSWGEGTVTEDPTCTKKGTMTYTCAVCGKVKTEEIAAGHIVTDFTKENVIEPTCTEQGSYDYVEYCSVCKEEVFRMTVISAALGHDPEEVLTKATDKRDGSRVKRCRTCQKELSKTVIPMVKTVKLEKTSFTYTGSNRKLTFIIKDRTGKAIGSYSVSYPSGRKTIGSHTAKVTLKGDYSVVKTLKFKILPKKVTDLKLTSPKKGQLKVTYKKLTGGVKYQIRYRVKGTSKWKNVYTSNTSKLFKALKRGKTYQVQVRAYKKVDGVTFSGAWSATKAIKVKK